MRAGHTYSLQPYEGPGSRFTCPACGGKRCFTRYVDENGDWLDEAVGRCNHESRCGYHYTPRQFFEDHPSARPDWKENFFRIPQQTIKKTSAPLFALAFFRLVRFYKAARGDDTWTGMHHNGWWAGVDREIWKV